MNDRRAQIGVLGQFGKGGTNMFKSGLLITTALIAAVSLSPAAARPSPYGQCIKRALHFTTPRDANEEFLSTYGGFLVSGYNYYSGSSLSVSRWTQVAVPITGHGGTVSHIRVREQAAHAYSSSFTVGIYSNAASGFPGNLIAGGVGYAPTQYAPVTISIAPTTLKRRTTYWVEERVYRPTSQTPTVYWQVDPTAKRKAYVQHHQCTNQTSGLQSSSTTPWMQQSTGPYFRVMR